MPNSTAPLVEVKNRKTGKKDLIPQNEADMLMKDFPGKFIISNQNPTPPEATGKTKAATTEK